MLQIHKNSVNTGGGGGSEDAPHLLKGRANLGTGECSREWVVTDRHRFLCVVHVNLTDEKKKHPLMSVDQWISSM